MALRALHFYCARMLNSSWSWVSCTDSTRNDTGKPIGQHAEIPIVLPDHLDGVGLVVGVDCLI